jgi:hypothetical protein
LARSTSSTPWRPARPDASPRLFRPVVVHAVQTQPPSVGNPTGPALGYAQDAAGCSPLLSQHQQVQPRRSPVIRTRSGSSRTDTLHQRTCSATEKEESALTTVHANAAPPACSLASQPMTKACHCLQGELPLARTCDRAAAAPRQVVRRAPQTDRLGPWRLMGPSRFCIRPCRSKFRRGAQFRLTPIWQVSAPTGDSQTCPGHVDMPACPAKRREGGIPRTASERRRPDPP